MSDLNLSSVSGKAVQAATFARGAYDTKTPFVPPTGFEPLEVKLVNPQSPDFAASAYVNPKTGELVVAYRGSDSTTDLTTALKAAANGTWNGQFTDAAAYMKQAQGMAADAVGKYAEQENITDPPKIITLATGHSLGGMLAQVVAKMYGVEAQVQDAPGAARLVDTPQFKQTALENGQPESGHDITGKIQNVTTSNIAKLGEQFQETQVVPIPALGQMGGLDTLATLGTFLAYPPAGLATGEALQTVAEHSAAKIEDALYMLAGVKGQIADAGALTLQTMFLDRDGKPVSYAPISSGDSSSSTWQIQALVDKSGKAIAFFDREVVDGEMQPVAVVVQSGNRIHLAHAQDASSLQVIETTVSGERRVLSQSELLTSLQDARGTPEVNIYSADSVNGMDLQSDQVHKAQENTQQSESDASGTLPDTSASTNANNFTNYLSSHGDQLTTAQQDALAAQLDHLNLGTDKALSFYTLPGGGALIATADGDIVGEIVHSSSGDLNLKASAIDASGKTVEVNNHINEQGSVQTQEQYNTQAQQQASALFNSLMAANNWGHLSDVGKLSALVNLYNATDKLGEAFGATGDNLPGDLGAASGWLSLAQGLQSGDGLIIANGINVVSDRALDNAMNEAFGNTAAGESVPYLSYALAIRNFEDNPEVAAGTMAGTYIGEDIGAAMGGPIGAAIGGALGGMIGGALGGLFGDDDIPMRQGLAHAQWDAQGQTQIITTQDAEGGGSTANSWMSSLVDGLQTQLQTYNSQHNASDGLGLALIPNLLPSVGFKYDPDGYNLANGARGFMYLQWNDEQGHTQTRFYDGAGNRGDDSGETLSGDFVQHAQSAIAPAWQVQTVLAHYQQSGDIDLPTQANSLPQALSDGLHQTLQVVSLGLTSALPTEATPSNQLIDVDGDGYLEQTQWVQANQAILSVDLNGDGQISLGETVNLQDAAQVQQARTSLAWLDANQDARLTAQDPAFAALKLWVDVNADGKGSATELQSLSQAGITAIDFSTNPPRIERADGSVQSLNVQTLTANTLGVAFQTTAAGLVQTTEQQDGTGQSVQYAVNTRAFDGQAAHTQGGTQDVEGSHGAVVQADASKLATTTYKTIANTSVQTSTTVGVGDARLKSAATATVTPTVTSAASTSNSETRVAFVPAGQNSAQSEVRLVTQDMIESAGSSMFGAAGLGVLGAVGLGATASAAEAAAVQANVVSAGNNANPSTTSGNAVSTNNQFTTTLPTSGASSNMSSAPSTPAEVVVKQADVFSAPVSVVQGVQTVQTAATSTTTSSNASPVFVSSTPVSPVTEAAPVVVVKAVVISSATSSKASSDGTSTTSSAPATATTSTDATSTTSSVSASASAAIGLTLDYPVVIGETLPGTEDVVLYLKQDVLLANDSSPNARADANAPALTITAVADAVNGQVSLNDGVVVFMPNTNFHGEASFTYTVTDQYGLSTTGSTSLVIVAVNDAPVTQGETAQTQEDTAIYFNVADLLSNDSDVDTATDGQVLSITGIAAAQHGTATLLVDGRIRFVPDSNFHGTAQFTYIVNDGNDVSNNGSTTATVKVDVSAVNDAPVTQQDTASVDEDTAIVFSQAELLANDSDVDTATDGQALTITAVSGATNGTVSMFANGGIRFIPSANYHGAASFTYTVSDGNGATTDASVSITVNAVNDTPVVQGESTDTSEDTTLYIAASKLLANDSDVDTATDGQVLSLSAVSSINGQTHGTVSLINNADGTQTVQFTPDANYHGVASFNYTVSDGNGGYATAVATINLAAVNDAPVAVGETSGTDEDSAIVLTQAELLANDSDVDTATDGQVLTITAVSGATNGTVSMLANGDIRFIPNANYHGAASFIYTVSDGNGATTDASVSITVNAVNDTPVVQGESTSTNEDTTLYIAASKLLANDSDVDTITDGQVLSLSAVSSISGQTHGTVSLVNNADGTQTVQFTPDANYHGVASFNYTVSDGNGGYATALATINIAAVNDAPVTVGEISSTDEDTAIFFTQAQLLDNDSDVDTATDGQVLTITAVSGATNGTVSMLANGDIRFIPNANYHGAASFTYTVSDGNGATTDASVNLTVLAVNDSPIALGDVFVTQEDSAIVLTSAQLLANDTDNDISTDGDVLTISRVFDALHCTATLNTDGTINLVPDAQYHGNVRFSYEITDASGATSTAFVVAGVSAVNDAPVSQSDSFDGTEDTLIILEQADVLANDTDNDVLTDGDSLSVQSVGNASHGTVRLLTSGQIEFLPDANYHGLATFDYVVTDTFGATSTNTVTLSIGAVNDTPVVQGESTYTSEDTTLYIQASKLLANDSDVDTITDGQVLSLSAVSSISEQTHGTVSLINNADGTQTVQYTPDANYHGVASFNYTVSDGNGGYATALATINIAAVNDAPVTVGEISSTDEDTGLTFTQAQLLSNDSDVDTATDGQVLTITAVSGATNGTVSMLANGNIQFIPNANYHGAASFTYTVSDGNGATTDASVSITVNAVNDTPVVQGESTDTNEDTTLYIAASKLLANDSDVDTATDGQVLSVSAVNSISGKTHGAVSLINNADGTQTVQFAPDANYHGVASFNYTVSDGNGGYATALATINLAAVNDAPMTVGEISSTDEDSAIEFTQAELLANDSDVDTATDGQVLTITAVSGATNGTVSMLANGNIQFVPNANYHGAASFTYTVSDGNGATTDASVSITVNAVNDTPVVQGESTSTYEDTTLYIAASKLLANDSDVDTITDGQVLSLSAVSSISGQTHGTVSLLTNADGTQTVQFVPDANYHGVASFNYTVSDGNGGYATAVATINIAAVNDAPVAVGEISSTDEDSAIEFTQAELLANDSDVDTATDGQALTITAVSGATNGTVSMLASGDIRFIPNANYHGAASFTYTVSDGNGATTDASVNLTVLAVNDSPVVQGESTDTSEDTTLYIAASKLLANDSDVDTATDGQVLSLSAVNSISGQTHGTVSLVTNADGTQTVQFTPDANYHGVATFNYTVSDGNGGYATALATINLAAVNDVPVTVGETSSTDEDTGLTFTQAELLANDSDVDTATDGQALTITAVSGAINGTVSMLANGDIQFIPSANYHGAASFTYTVSDGNGATTDASVNLTVLAVNDTPVVQGESTSTYEDTTLSIAASTLLINDSDVDTATDGQVLSLSAVNSISGQTHGTVSLVTNADGTQTVQFTPDANYHGVASFNYTVSDGNGGYATAVATINLAAVNDAPVTVDETSSTDEDAAILFTQAQLLANDSDVDAATDGQVLSITAVSGATNGTVSMLASGDIRFIPNANYHGAASFTYTVSDGNGATTDASVSITVNAINDTPVVQGESTSTNEDTTLSIAASTLLTNDSDVDTATDGQVLSLSAVNSISGQTHGTVSLVNNADGTQTVQYTPDANYHGVASFNYTVSDGNGGYATALATINIAAVNDAPVTVGEISSTDEDTGLTFTQAQLLSNDSDVDTATDGQVLTITAVSGATNGTVSMLANGDIRFIPNANYHGAASFTYTVSDGNGGTTDASVSITVNAVNDVPVVTGETVSTNEDTTLWFIPSDLLTNDTDVDVATDGQVLSITAVSNATHGTVGFVAQADGSRRIAFTPDANYFGVASFQYTVSDGNGGTATTTVVINLSAVNDAPDAVADSVNATEDTLLTVTSTSLLNNDSDVDNLHSALRIVGVSNATHGSVSLGADGSISFNPDLNYFGVATFNYTVSDGVGGFSVGTATVNIAPVNDNPVAVGESLTLNEDEVATLTVASLLDNDSDVDNTHAQLSILSVGGATHGSVSLVTTNGNTNVVFTPELNFYGAASFTYTISDGVGGTATASMSLNFTSVNDAPVVNNELYAGKRNVSYSLLAAALLTNDTDVETPNSLTLASVGNAQHGSVSLTNGNIVFVPESGYAGRGSFDYVVRDADGGQTTGTTQIDFSHVNANPTAVDDSFSGTEDTPISITTAQLLVNDSDSDNASSSLSIASLGSATHGTVSFDAQGNVLFTPNANFNGQASFTYQVTDPDGGSTWATASLSIASVNDAPIIEDIWYGRPVYGYELIHATGYDGDGNPYPYIRYDAITSVPHATSILHSGSQLYKVEFHQELDSDGSAVLVANYRPYSPTYYMNGDLRPISFDTNDATLYRDDESSTPYFGNDPYRQNGGVVAYDPDGDNTALTFSVSSTPQHGHAWANQHTSSSASGGLDYTQVGTYWVSDQGAWQYYSSKGDEYSGSDPFTVRVTDTGGASVDATVTATHTSWPVSGGGGGGCFPVVIDLDGDGVELISPDDSQVFDDVNSDGWRERVGWVGSDDGFLALDRNGDGLIDPTKDISFVHDLPEAHTDLEGLRAHDTNGDGLISANDAEWGKFGIWRDANSNGIQELGEFRTLDDLGVASIALASDNKLRVDQGNVVFGETQVNLTSGKSLVAADVMLAGQGVAYPTQVQDALLAQQAEVMRQALLFNQVCTTAIAETELGFVDTSDPSWHGLAEPSHDALSDSRATG